MFVKFDSWLDTREISDKVYQLLDDFVVHVHTETTTIEVTIKAGFITDYASVPRIPFAYLLYGGIGNYAAVLHDGLYSKSSLVTVINYDTREPFQVTRAWADEVFYLGLIERKISAVKAKPMYWGVRIKGGKYYQRDK